MSINRPEEWEDLGKPSILAKISSEKRARFKAFMEADTPENARDIHMKMLWAHSQGLKKTLSAVTWSAFGMYLISIFAVNYLLGKFG